MITLAARALAPFIFLLFFLDLGGVAGSARAAEIPCSDRYVGFASGGAQVRALKKIGNEALLEPFRLDPARHSREDFFRTAAKVIDIDSFIEAQELARLPIYPELRSRLDTLGPEFRALFLDPATIVHGRELLDFLTRAPHHWQDPWELRKAFSEYLGRETVFRGLTLNERERETIREKGLLPGYLRQPRFAGYVRSFGTSYESQLKRHTSNGAADSMFQSVTSNRHTAISVAARPLAAALALGDTSYATYVYELSIPKLDLIFYNSESYPASLSYAELYKKFFSVSFAGKTIEEGIPGGPALESFVYAAIPPSEIQSVTKIEHAEKYEFVSPPPAKP